MEEKAATSAASLALGRLVLVIAVAMSLYHMYVAAFGPPEAMIFRGTHLIFALTLVFLLYPLRPAGGLGWRALDLALLIAGWGLVLHIFLNYQTFTNRIIYIDELTAGDRTWAVIAVLVVLEATRRVIGWALPLTAIAFLAYSVAFTHVTMPALMEQVYFSTEGIFGSTLGVSASYVMLFVLFGAFMEKSGTGQLFMDFAMSITGHTAGGPGKVAVVSSSLFGTVSGSAVANVMVDGPITIRPASRSASPPWKLGSRDNAKFTRAVAPGCRMFSVRQTIVGPSATGSQSRAVRLGSIADTTSGAGSSVPSDNTTPVARSPRVTMFDTSAPVRISTPSAVAACSRAPASAPVPPRANVAVPGAPPSVPAESCRNTCAVPVLPADW